MKILKFIVQALIVIVGLMVLIIASLLDYIPLKITKQLATDMCWYMSLGLDWLNDNFFKIRKRYKHERKM